jgi:hypothetical protein
LWQASDGPRLRLDQSRLVVARSGGLEQTQIDGVCHRLIARVIWMQVVAGIVSRGKLSGVVGIASRGVKVDDAVEDPGGPYPVVDILAFGLADFRVISGALEWRDRSAVDLHAA